MNECRQKVLFSASECRQKLFDVLNVRALPPEVIGKLVPPELRFRIATPHATSEFVMPPEVENQCRQMGVRGVGRTACVISAFRSHLRLVGAIDFITCTLRET
jgi:hypothetical protein